MFKDYCLMTENFLKRFKFITDVTLIPNKNHQQNFIMSIFYYIKNSSINYSDPVYEDFKEVNIDIIKVKKFLTPKMTG